MRRLSLSRRPSVETGKTGSSGPVRGLPALWVASSSQRADELADEFSLSLDALGAPLE